MRLGEPLSLFRLFIFGKLLKIRAIFLSSRQSLLGSPILNAPGQSTFFRNFLCISLFWNSRSTRLLKESVEYKGLILGLVNKVWFLAFLSFPFNLKALRAKDHKADFVANLEVLWCFFILMADKKDIIELFSATSNDFCSPDQNVLVSSFWDGDSAWSRPHTFGVPILSIWYNANILKAFFRSLL